MNAFDKTSFKIAGLLLLILFLGDSLAIFDFMESSAFGAHFGSVAKECAGEAHMHTSSEDQHKSWTDSCLLCPCCVSAVNMCMTLFTFPPEQPPIGILTFDAFGMNGFSKGCIFHPPKLIS